MLSTLALWPRLPLCVTFCGGSTSLKTLASTSLQLCRRSRWAPQSAPRPLAHEPREWIPAAPPPERNLCSRASSDRELQGEVSDVIFRHVRLERLSHRQL